MNQVIDHVLIVSFKEFLNNKILSDLAAFTNKTVDLYEYSPKRISSSKAVYGSSFAPWIYDSSISGAQIPSGVGSLNRGVSGLSIDFFNGRVLCNSGVSLPTGTINVSIPDFDVKITSKSESALLLEKKYLQSPVLNAPNAPIEPDGVILPAIYIKVGDSYNKQFALGGIDESTWSMRVSVFADSDTKILGIQKVFRDVNQQVFPLLSATPFNELFDLKTGSWNYSDQMATDGSNIDNLIYIEDSTFKVYDDDTIAKIHPKLILAVATFKLKKHRITN